MYKRQIEDDWEWVFYGDGAYCAIPEGRDNYYLSWQTGKTFKFEIDDDGNVLGLTRLDPALAGGHLFINPFILDKNDQNIMYMTIGRYIWRNDSLDAIPIIGDEYNPIEQGWQRVQESYIGFDVQQPSISCLEISREPAHILYYGTSAGGMFRLDDAHAVEPVQTDIKNGLPNGYVSSVAVDPMNCLLYTSPSPRD